MAIKIPLRALPFLHLDQSFLIIQKAIKCIIAHKVQQKVGVILIEAMTHLTFRNRNNAY